MARRAGKAGSRRSRQRPPRRPIIPQPGLAPRAPATFESPDTTVPTAGAAAGVPVTPAGPRPAMPFAPRRQSGGPGTMTLGSGLGERGRLEYHYVIRDLRNIAILSAIIVVALIVAWLVLPALGLVPARG